MPTNVNEPRRTDPFPIVLGAIIGALVVGLLVVVYLISAGGNNNTVSSTTNSISNSTGLQPTTAANAPGSSDATGAGTPTEEPAPRMPLADFKALYDDPSKRPLIIDVRAKQYYDEGHIKGAESFPESDVDTRVKELPKDKLIVAYCQ